MAKGEEKERHQAEESNVQRNERAAVPDGQVPLEGRGVWFVETGLRLLRHVEV